MDTQSNSKNGSKIKYADMYGGLTNDELEEEQRLQEQDVLIEKQLEAMLLHDTKIQNSRDTTILPQKLLGKVQKNLQYTQVYGVLDENDTDGDIEQFSSSINALDGVQEAEQNTKNDQQRKKKKINDDYGIFFNATNESDSSKSFSPDTKPDAQRASQLGRINPTEFQIVNSQQPLTFQETIDEETRVNSMQSGGHQDQILRNVQGGESGVSPSKTRYLLSPILEMSPRNTDYLNMVMGRVDWIVKLREVFYKLLKSNKQTVNAKKLLKLLLSEKDKFKLVQKNEYQLRTQQHEVGVSLGYIISKLQSKIDSNEIEQLSLDQVIDLPFDRQNEVPNILVNVGSLETSGEFDSQTKADIGNIMQTTMHSDLAERAKFLNTQKPSTKENTRSCPSPIICQNEEHKTVFKPTSQIKNLFGQVKHQTNLKQNFEYIEVQNQSLSGPKHYFSERQIEDVHQPTEISDGSDVSQDQTTLVNPLECTENDRTELAIFGSEHRHEEFLPTKPVKLTATEQLRNAVDTIASSGSKKTFNSRQQIAISATQKEGKTKYSSKFSLGIAQAQGTDEFGNIATAGLVRASPPKRRRSQTIKDINQNVQTKVLDSLKQNETKKEELSQNKIGGSQQQKNHLMFQNARKQLVKKPQKKILMLQASIDSFNNSQRNPKILPNTQFKKAMLVYKRSIDNQRIETDV